MPEHVEHFPGSEISHTYDRARNLISFGLDNRWKRAALRAAGRNGLALRHVDLGTGSGSMIAAARGRTSRSVGVDHEVAMLARARRTDGNARWVAGDFRALPLRAHTVDLVTAAYVLRYAADPRDLVRLAREVLRPGGTFLAYELTFPRSLLLRAALTGYLVAATTLLGLLLNGAPRQYWHLWQSIPNFDLPRLLDALRAEGFVETAVHTAAGGGIVWVIARSA